MRRREQLSKQDRVWTERRLARTISRVEATAALAEKLWDTFRSMNYYRGVCRKTYVQLGVPSQNVWLAVAATAQSEARASVKRRRRPTTQ